MYKILIVEDEDIIRKGLMFMMNWTKYNCVIVGEAVNGKDALEKITQLHPDIVITDVKMPYKDGIQLLEESIENFNYEAIIISGYSEFDYAQKAISLGVSDYLLKPIDMEYLAKTLEKIINKIDCKQILKQYSNSKENSNSIQIIKPLEKNKLKTKYVVKMLNYIKNHYKDKISITDLSFSLDISNTYLNAKFKEETNYTFNDFLNRYRIQQSVEMLKQGNMKVYEIAEAVGFQDYKYFIQVFKKYIGYSPIKFVSSCQ